MNCSHCFILSQTGPLPVGPLLEHPPHLCGVCLHPTLLQPGAAGRRHGDSWHGDGGGRNHHQPGAGEDLPEGLSRIPTGE